MLEQISSVFLLIKSIKSTNSPKIDFLLVLFDIFATSALYMHRNELKMTIPFFLHFVF